jgi:replicative DNA helicase
MTDKRSLQSEGEQLDAVLEELQNDNAVREISGWETGFPNLSRALDGILPGLYLLIGPPASGKTSLAKQLLDQVVMRNAAPGVFFSLAETSKELRIKTLARLSGLESREIRRGSAYLLHWYGVPKAHHAEAEQLAPSWEKLKRTAEEARSWLDRIYLVECDRETKLLHIEEQIQQVKSIKGTDRVMVVIDDCQSLGNRELTLNDRLVIVAEELQGAAMNLGIAILAVWPDLGGKSATSPQAWAEKLPGADAILVLEKDHERTKQLTEPNQAMRLHIVKNRGGERAKLALDFYPAFSRFAEPQVHSISSVVPAA